MLPWVQIGLVFFTFRGVSRPSDVARPVQTMDIIALIQDTT